MIDHSKFQNKDSGKPVQELNEHHVQFLQFLQNYDRNYFKFNHIEHDYQDLSIDWPHLIYTLHEKDLVEKWNDGTDNKIVWMLTDKGKDVDPRGLIE